MNINFKDKEIGKIIEFAEFMGLAGIQLVHNLNSSRIYPDNPAYNRAEQVIKLVQDMDEERIKYTLLHELGHYREDIMNRFPLHWCVNYGTPQPQWSEEQTIQEEYHAWANAEYIAKILNIKLGASYKKFKEACLQTYIEHYRNNLQRKDVLRDKI